MATPYRRHPYPTRLTIDIHSYCNARCVMCPYPALAKTLPMGTMPWELYARIVDDFGAICRRRDFRGRLGYCMMAEPFAGRAGQEILKYIERALGHNLRIYLTTNAALLQPRIVDGLNELGFDGHFRLSCHGITPETIKRVMGLELDRMLANIDYLIEHYPKDRIDVTAIHIDWPAGERAQVLRHWKARGVKVHSPLPGSRAGLLPAYETGQARQLTGCGSKRPLYHMTVAFNGDVPLCCNDMARQVIVGNLAENTIEEVWNNEAFTTAVDRVYGHLPAPADFLCRKCEWARHPRSTPARVAREIRRSARKVRLWFSEKRRPRA